MDELDKAYAKLAGWAQGGATSSNLPARRNAEMRYAIAYQVLVRKGEKPQLRKKYR